MKDLNVTRKVHTQNMPIGGGKDFPTTNKARQSWLQSLQEATNVPLERLEVLLDRYGTRAESIAHAISQGADTPLESLSDYSRAEIVFIVQQEMVNHVDDFLQRRSLIAMLGYITLNPDVLDEVANVIGETLGWDATRIDAEIQRMTDLLREKHGVKL